MPQVALDKASADGVEKAGHIRTLMAKVEDCEGTIRHNESTRRKLHNTILELKGTWGGGRSEVCMHMGCGAQRCVWVVELRGVGGGAQ